jgi:hypothetical protein
VSVAVLACFLLCRISIPNGVQMPRNLLKNFFYPEDTQGAKEAHGRRPVGPTRHQGAPGSLGVLWWIVEPTGSFSTDIHLYKYSKIPKTLGESRKYSFRRRKFQNHEIQSRGLFRHSAGGGNDHGGVLHHPCCPSDDA